MVSIVFAIAVAGLLLALFISRNIHELMDSAGASDPDGYVHMVMTREIRENGHRIPDRIGASVFDWRFSYPYLMHFLLSFLPERYYESIDRVFPTLMDLVYMGILAALVPLGLIDTGAFLLVLALFVTTPQFAQNAGGMGLSARKPGIILGTLSFLSFYLWTSGGPPWILVLSAVFGGLTHLTSRFGTQAVVFFYLGFTVVDPLALAVLVGSFVSAIILSLGTYLVVFRSHLLFWHNYAVRSQFVFLYDGFKSIDTARRLFGARSVKDVLSGLYRSLLLKTLLNNPYAVAATTILGWSLWTVSPIVSRPIAVWFATGMILCVMTSIYGLRFLGEPGRYLNFAFIPGVLIVINGSRSFPTPSAALFAAVLAVGVLMFAGYALSHRVKASVNEKQGYDDVVEFLNVRDPGSIVVQPRHMGSEIAWKVPGARVADLFGDGYSSKAAKQQAQTLFKEEPFLTDDIGYIGDMCDPDWVLFESDSVAAQEEAILRPPDSEAAFTKGQFELYRWETITDDR